MSRLRVLIVEDEAIIALSLEALIGSHGHQVCGTAATTAEAIALAERERPDIAIMDIHLAEGSSGTEAAAELYNRWGIRCLFLSGNLDEGTRAAVAPFAPLGFVGKPFLPTRFAAALDRAVLEWCSAGESEHAKKTR